MRNARFIRAQAIEGNGSGDTTDLSKETGGILNVDHFVNSRTFEIRQLYQGMRSSKRSGATRVFQSLPRNMRRRTASHNVRRIPKRMHNRAKREMLKNSQSKDISVTGLAKTKKKLSAKELYRARMSVKLLRLFTKSTQLKFSMDFAPNNATIRQRIKLLTDLLKNAKNSQTVRLNNPNGSHDNTTTNELAKISHHRIKYAKRQSQFNWLSTHIWHAKRSHMIKRWSYQIPYSPTQKCYKLTHRIGGNAASSDGALVQDSSFIGTMILQHDDAMVVSQVAKLLTKGKGNLIKYRKNSNWYQGFLYDLKSQDILGQLDLLWLDQNRIMLRLHPAVFEITFQSILQLNSSIKIQDCRYSLASITLQGAKSLTALSSVIRTASSSNSFEQFKKISSLSDYSCLPNKTFFAFNAIDPRHLATPSPLGLNLKNQLNSDDVLDLQNNFPKDEINQVLNKLSDPKERNQSYQNQLTLKQLAKRRQNQLQLPQNSNQIPFDKSKDPLIPILIVKRPKTNDWVLIVPWFWLLPFWYQLNRISRVYHIGLRQAQQLSYERRSLYYPDDYPFTQMGYSENTVYKRNSKKNKWDRKAVGKRLNYIKIQNIHSNNLPAIEGEIGDYFSCDWKFLQMLRNGINYLTQDGSDLKLIEKSRTASFENTAGLRDINVLNDVLELYKDITQTSEVTTETLPLPVVLLFQKEEVYKLPINSPIQLSITNTPLPITAISCNFLERGHPKDNARIYTIPEEHLSHWTQVAKGVYRADGKRDHDLEHPSPDIQHLIGYATSGTFHLSEGQGVANGFVDTNALKKNNHNYLLMRNVGTDVYRVVQWSYINL